MSINQPTFTLGSNIVTLEAFDTCWWTLWVFYNHTSVSSFMYMCKLTCSATKFTVFNVLFTLPCLVHTTDTDNTRLPGLVLSCLVGGMNKIGDKSRLFSVLLKYIVYILESENFVESCLRCECVCN